LKGKKVAKKMAEITETMKQAAALVHSYVPPDPKRIQSVKAAGNLAVVPTGPDSIRLDLRNYTKSGDVLSLGLDTARSAIQTMSVKSYLESEKDPVTAEVTFARLREGLSYPGSVVLSVPEENIQVVVQNSNYVRVTPAETPAAKPPAVAPASTGGASTTAIDTLTAPIALYPDALIAQILAAATDFAALSKLSDWMGQNESLKGSELQDAAAKAGFAPCYIALAPFPQVVKMMVEKPDWTKELGKAYASDPKAVLDSIQRLRAQAQALGNLKTTPQQEVVTETTSTGEQVIAIYPANPQVIYVPVYHTETVYVQQAPPPSSSSSSSDDAAAAALVGFTVGIIIGAASNDYYYGPYGYRGGYYGAYDEAWDRREDYYEDRQDYREDVYEDRQDYAEERRENAQENQGPRQEQRQSAAQENQAQRQSTAQENQAQRQSTAQENQAQRQSTAQSNQANRQTGGATSETAQANQASRQSAAQSNQANRQSTAQTNRANRQSTAQANQSSRQSTAYSNGGRARAQSSRGTSSRAGRGGAGRRR
jgi:hypothetical protein